VNGGTNVHIRRKINSLGALGISLAVLAPLTTAGVLAVGAASAPSAFAGITPGPIYCTDFAGTVNFKQTAAPALTNGLTAEGYFETSNTKSKTTVTSTKLGACYDGTDSTHGSSAGSSNSQTLTISSSPCKITSSTMHVCGAAVDITGETGKYWYGSGTQYATSGTSSLLSSLPTVTFTISGVTLTFHSKYAKPLISSNEAGFEVYGYVTSTSTGYDYKSSTTCTSESSSKCAVIVAMLGADTGTHYHSGNNFLQDVSHITTLASWPPTGQDAVVKIDTAILDNATNPNGGTSGSYHSFAQL